MPGFNQKGPMGQGSMTGHKMGRCTNFGAGPKNQPESGAGNESIINSEEFFRGGFGMGRGGGGFGRGMGRGMGRQNRFRGGQ